MSKRKKNIKQVMSELTYNKPGLDKRFTNIKKGFGEISSMLNDKTKK